MGMYTELRFFAKIRNPPADVEAVLRCLAGADKQELPLVAIDHQFFRSSRWAQIGWMDSYHFAADSGSSFRYNKIANAYFLTIQCNLKNYDSEIEKFINWVTPYCEGIGPLDGDGEPYEDGFPGTFMGYYRYEEAETPTLIHHDGRKA